MPPCFAKSSNSHKTRAKREYFILNSKSEKWKVKKVQGFLEDLLYHTMYIMHAHAQGEVLVALGTVNSGKTCIYMHMHESN